MRRAPLFFAVLITTFGCAGGRDTALPGARASSTSSGVDEVIAALREAGVQVRSSGTVDQPFFPVPAQVYTVDGNDLQLYEFATAADAESAAAEVSPTGSAVGTSMMSWMAPPHFFRKDRVIANYLGSSEKILAELQGVLGPQFAGR